MSKLITLGSYADDTYRGEVWGDDGIEYLGPSRDDVDTALEDALDYARGEEDVTIIDPREA